jgi:hypothetical protein
MSDRQRLIVAVLLILVVWFVPMLIWPAKRPPDRRIGGSTVPRSVQRSGQRHRRNHPPNRRTAQPPPQLRKTPCGSPGRGTVSASAHSAADSSRQN